MIDATSRSLWLIALVNTYAREMSDKKVPCDTVIECVHRISKYVALLPIYSIHHELLDEEDFATFKVAAAEVERLLEKLVDDTFIHVLQHHEDVHRPMNAPENPFFLSFRHMIFQGILGKRKTWLPSKPRI
ncbi:hypothetical protein BofuT4_P072910.1 [Botrytis cinerea T4]|uniref:Uncharacterized protein n=1 Tax=Botryotinia fuckeliana (strain T4) TaxID=999810 RepID=G2XP73_BOTF4|nr:hypothetical protein BofuT4_P072910.1 [Botrytis cinerea T4]